MHTRTIGRRGLFTAMTTGLILLAAWLPWSVSTARAQSTDAVIAWNMTAFTVTASVNQLPQARILAIMHAAIHDALNSIDRRYTPYARTTLAPSGASPEAAVATAAAEVLLAQVPSQRAAIEAALAAALAVIPNSLAKEAGIETGRASAQTMLALRANDGADNAANVPYVPGTKPGDYQYTPGVTAAGLPGWGRVTPFVLDSARQHRSVPPDPIGSDEYDRDFNQVKAIGGAVSSVRTPEQTNIALFWQEPGVTSWNRIARILSAARGVGLWDNARLFTLVNFALNDGLVAGWEGKYYFDYWRPVTAIRRAHLDGNGDTQPDPEWLPVFATPGNPDYPSTNSIMSAASAVVMASIFGDATSFAMTTNTLPNVTRSFASFSAAADDVAISRVYAGIHFRKSTLAGNQLGRDVGQSVIGVLRPVGPR